MPKFKEFEWKMEQAIGKRFGIDPELFKCVELKRADMQLLVDEKAVLMVEEPEPWPNNAPEVKDARRIKAWGWEESKKRFLAEFERLRN